jgi:hypothetical protein
MASALLIFYAPIHTIYYCLTHINDGFMACVEEIGVATLSSALLYGISCTLF